MAFKKKNSGAFGFDVPEFELPEVAGAEIMMPDLGLDDDADAEELLARRALFDVNGTDDNSFTRYMRPRPAVIPDNCVRYAHAFQLARELAITPGMRVDAFIGGSFIFGDMIEAWLTNREARGVDMTIATLSMNQDNVNSLRIMMDAGIVRRLRVMVSAYFYMHERRDLIPYIYKRLDIGDDRFQLAVADVHTKSCHFDLDGMKMVIHGSANLRSSGNIEQITIEENPALFWFYEETYNKLFDQFKTINHPVRGRESWKQLERRLTTDYTEGAHYATGSIDTFTFGTDEGGKGEGRRKWHGADTWEEAVCDLKDRYGFIMRKDCYVAHSFKKTADGYPISEIKTEKNVGLFADRAEGVIRGLLRMESKGGWCIVTGPKRRHKERNFASMVCCELSRRLGIPFHEDAVQAMNRARINPVFRLVKTIEEPGVILYDDIFTTGSTMYATLRLLEGKNVFPLVGINNA